jgi:hypothetical protein
LRGGLGGRWRWWWGRLESLNFAQGLREAGAAPSGSGAGGDSWFLGGRIAEIRLGSWRQGGWPVGGDYDFGFRGGLNPQTLFIDMGEGVGGANYVLCGDVNAVGFFDNVAEGEAESAVAEVEEPEGVSVMVDGGAGLKVELFHDHKGAAPLQEGFLDQVAGGMLADIANAAVAGEVHFIFFDKIDDGPREHGFLGSS